MLMSLKQRRDLCNSYLFQVDETFVHFDSLHKSNEADARTIAKKLSVFTNGTHTFSGSPYCIPQDNGYDCGCHVLRNAELILEYVKGTEGKGSLTTPNCPT